MNTHAFTKLSLPAGAPPLRIGIDIACVSDMAVSFEAFGQRLLSRLFSADEAAYAMAVPALAAQRLAARFAAKEAAIKAFGWSEAGIGWRDIEVRRDASGACTLVLHDLAAELVERSGCTQLAVSLTHEGDYAAAVVAAMAAAPPVPIA